MPKVKYRYCLKCDIKFRVNKRFNRYICSKCTSNNIGKNTPSPYDPAMGHYELILPKEKGRIYEY